MPYRIIIHNRDLSSLLVPYATQYEDVPTAPSSNLSPLGTDLVISLCFWAAEITKEFFLFIKKNNAFFPSVATSLSSAFMLREEYVTQS